MAMSIPEKTRRFSATQRLTPALLVSILAFILERIILHIVLRSNGVVRPKSRRGLGVMLLWTLFLISSVLLIARGLIRGVNSLE